jgi:hypothetical protein
VTGFSRLVALVLALVWLSAGLFGLVLGVMRQHFLLIALSLLALSYAFLWLRVVARSRLLSWRGFVFPWRTG